tara:strand:- start:530 stop:811 length:282 start_codon:yes stop_codon:yes gene_type:complete
MASSRNQAAKEWAKIGMCDSAFAASLRTKYRALATQSISPGGLDSVTQATKNAVSMGKQVGLSVLDTMAAMRIALEWIDLGYVPVQSRSLGRF